VLASWYQASPPTEAIIRCYVHMIALWRSICPTHSCFLVHTRDSITFKDRRAIPFDRMPGVHAIHFFRGRRPLTKVMATTLTAFYSTFVMPSWRGMLNLPTRRRACHAASYSPVQLVSTTWASRDCWLKCLVVASSP
jgi:hypothetical protein